MTFLWISATALKSDQRCRQRGTQSVHYRCNSRRELVDCLNNRIFKFVQALPLQSPVEGDTNISAGQPKLDVIHLVDHRVLGSCHLAVVQRRLGEKLTLIILRITLTVPKTALAGVTLENSLARFRASTAAFSKDRAPSRCFGRWGFVAMVWTRGSCKRAVRCEAVRKNPNPNGDERSSCRGAPRVNRLIS